MFSWKTNGIELNGKTITAYDNVIAKRTDSEANQAAHYNLDIFNLTKENAGIYRCMLGNEYGYDEITVDVEVLQAPKIENISVANLTDANIGHIYEGMAMYIVCETEGFPGPAIEWTKNGILVANDSRV